MATKCYKSPTSDDIKKMKLNDVLVHVKKAVEFLKGAKDYASKEVEDALTFLKNARKIDRRAVPKAAAEHGFGEIYLKMSKALEHDFESQKKSQGVTNLHAMESQMMNYSDGSPLLGCNLGKLGAVDYIVTTLNKLVKQPETDARLLRMDKLLGILINSIYHEKCNVNRARFRRAGAVGVMKKYLQSKEMFIKINALMILSYIVNENESEVLGRDNGVVVFMVDLLKKAVVKSSHKASVGEGKLQANFSVWELLNCLNHLSINDANKLAVWKNKGIPVITKMLTSEFTADEQRLAAKALWNLSFNDTVRKSDAMKESLDALKTLAGSKDKHLSTVCKNALWEIKEGSTREKKQTTAKKDDREHVMISYNWTHQERAKKIKDELEKAGYKVWIDVDKMEGDILDAMADAVTKSGVVLLCMSQPYHASQNCRSEATYAYKKQKPIIPLMVEPDYEPEGWLDILIGTKLYYKFTSDKEMRNNMPELQKAIGNRGK